MPVIHIPAFVGENGMPVGVSIVAGRSRDHQLLRVSQVLSDVLMSEGGWTLKPSLVCSDDGAALLADAAGNSTSMRNTVGDRCVVS